MDIFEFIGRLHPVILHLPIGIFAFTYLLEIVSRYKNRSDLDSAISIGLFIGMCFAVVTCITGLLLVENGDYIGSGITQHKWFGLGMTAMSILLVILHSKSEKGKLSIFYFPTFSILMIFLLITGHKGGIITHGAGFLWHKQSEEISFENVDEAVAYEHIIHPIFKNKCTSCHNPSKAKGKLDMTTFNALMKGGENGDVIVRGVPQESRIIERIHLEIEQEEHMPPKSKKQLTQDEIVLLEWWIEQGAKNKVAIGELNQSEQIANILSKYAKPTDSYDRLNILPVKDKTLLALRRNGINANVLNAESPLVEINMTHDQNVSKSVIRKFNAVDDQLSILKLGFSNVEDEMLSNLKNFKHLRRLQLQKTKITDNTVNNLSGLNYLQVLNLYGTKVTDDILNTLIALPALQKVYLWQTEVTDEFIKALQNERPLLEINFKQDADLFGDASLKPPLIVAAKDLFSDSLMIQFDLNFRNVKFLYTLDGSDPDSLSTVYADPIKIRETTLVKVKSVKEGWEDSEIAERQFVQSKYDVAEIQLMNQPADKYKASGAQTLVDFTKGSDQFTDGNWLGFEGTHMTAILDLGKEVDIQSLTVSALDGIGSWIFFPRGMTVWTSIDGTHFTLRKEADYHPAIAMEAPSVKNFTENFPLVSARYVKIKVDSQLFNPAWHPSPGGKSWLFLDEIVVN